MANFGEDMAMKIAQTIATKLENRLSVNESVVIVTDQLGKWKVMRLHVAHICNFHSSSQYM